MHIPEHEYNPYYKGYIEKAASFEILEGLESSFKSKEHFFATFPTSQWEFRYAEGKWTPKEIILHLIDTERVFGYRVLMLVRSENPSLPGFDQDEFVETSQANKRTVSSLLDEFKAVRASSISLFESIDEQTLQTIGVANGSNTSVRALGKIMIGHTLHHLSILNERYV